MWIKKLANKNTYRIANEGVFVDVDFAEGKFSHIEVCGNEVYVQGIKYLMTTTLKG